MKHLSPILASMVLCAVAHAEPSPPAPAAEKAKAAPEKTAAPA
jgi:hypothetical protein